jgi:glucosamine kinase
MKKRAASPLGMGIDAGGTLTRWALARPDGKIVASGEAPGISALMMKTTEGRNRIRAALLEIGEGAAAFGRPISVQAGVTGLGEREGKLKTVVAETFDLDEHAVHLQNDIVFTYLGLFAPGEGYVVYAGTGSVAAHIDAQGTLHRAGGRGYILDDGGGGFWIAREALRHVWREEDSHPGAWQESAMAREILARLGGTDWAHTREAIYGGERGDVGKLAVAVAQSADRDPAAAAILQSAGRELARLANAMVLRLGPKPVGLAGRAAHLHPSIAAAMRAALPKGIALEVRASEAHFAAARLAAKG